MGLCDDCGFAGEHAHEWRVEYRRPGWQAGRWNARKYERHDDADRRYSALLERGFTVRLAARAVVSGWQVIHVDEPGDTV